LIASNLTNYFSQLLNNSGKFVLCTRWFFGRIVCIEFF
jgi:hypothetical protein